jgi:hypothetical protein
MTGGDMTLTETDLRPLHGASTATEPVPTLEELTRLALAADPDAPLAEDAVPFGAAAEGDLPSWYMPVASGGGLSGRRGVAVAVLIVAALLMIVASGLCITYGQLTIA